MAEELFELTHYFKPYHYAIADNVFPPEILEELKNKFDQRDKFIKYTHMDHRYGIPLSKRSDKKIIDYLYSILPKIMEGFVDELNTMNLPRDISKYFIMELVSCIDTKGYQINAHCDILTKWITIVIYINGEGSTTTLMSSEKSDYCDVENKPNSALIFVPSINTYITMYVW